MTFNTSGMIRNLRTDRAQPHGAPGRESWACPLQGSLPGWERQEERCALTGRWAQLGSPGEG